MVREDGIYTFNSKSASKLSSIPVQESERLNDSTALISKNSLFVVSLVDEIRIFNMNLHPPETSGRSLQHQTYSTTSYIPAYWFWKVFWSDFICLSFPSVSEVQALMPVNNELYILKREYLSKVVRDQLTLVTFVTGGFLATSKYETDSHLLERHNQTNSNDLPKESTNSNQPILSSFTHKISWINPS